MTQSQRDQALKALRWLALSLAAFGTAAIFFAAGVVFRVLMGPVSLGPLNSELHAALRDELPGLQLKFDEAALQWSRDEGRINLVIFGTRVFDRRGRIIAQAPEAEIGLALGPFLAGKIIIRRIALVGVQLTLVHTSTGALRLGVGKDNGDSDVLAEIRNAIARNASTGTPALASFAVHRARLAFYDEETGTFVVAPDAELQVGDAKSGIKGAAVAASVDARIEISGRPAHLLATVSFPRNSSDVSGDFSLSGLSVAALAANADTFAFLKPFSLTADATGSFALVHGTTLRSADLGIDAAGAISGFGKPIHLRSIRLVARYDGQTHRVLIDDGSVTGEHLQAHFTGTNDFRFGADGSLSASAFSMTVDKLEAAMPGVLSREVNVAHALLRGSYQPAAHKIVLEQATVLGGPLSANLIGEIGLVPGKSPAIALDGKVNPLSVRDLLRYWPLEVGTGARSWIDRNISTGRLGLMLVHANIPAGGLDASSLSEDALSLSFPVTGATVTYLHGLPPLNGVTGAALLTGDTFKADVDTASSGNVNLTGGKVVIPNLHMHGMVGDISAHVSGSLTDILTLTDRKPLQYASRFRINPASVGGRAAVDLDFHVPMEKDVEFSRVAVGVKAAVTELSLSLSPHLRLSGGTANFDIDNVRLHATGQVAVGSTNVDLDWTEAIKTAPVTTHLTVRGTLDDAARAALSLHTEDLLSGPVGVVASLDGFRGAIQHATIDADLTPAAVSVDLVNIKKAPGNRATAQIAARLDARQNLQTADINISGGSLTARGTARFGTSGNLEMLDLASVKDGGLNDFALTMSETPANGFNLAVSGHSADGTAIGHKSTKPSGATKPNAPESNEPFHVSARLDRLVLRDGINMAPFSLDASGAGKRPRSLSLSGTMSNAARVTASIASTDSGRKVNIASTDAGQLLKGLFGFTSIKAGQLSVTATMPPVDASQRKVGPDYSGQATIRDFTLLNQAFMTRIFSSGSLQGFVDLMRGQGITIDSLQVPFQVTGDVIDVHDAVASGPSIGVTTDGYIDRGNGQLALQGAIAPLYGINGVLGAIPVVGNLFVSKKGEGVFGITYRATGNADEPQVSVNPLAMLAPGIFRRIFEGATPSAPSTQANASPPTKTQ